MSDPTPDRADAAPSHGYGPGSKGRAGVIFAKELREIFRDRRTLFGAVVSPLLITPLLIWLSGFFIQGQMKKEAQTVYFVGIVGASNSPTLADALRKTANTVWFDMPRAEADKSIADRKVKAAVVIPPGAEDVLNGDGAVAIKVLKDPGNDVSSSAAGRIDGALLSFGETVRSRRLKQAKLPSEFGTPIVVTDEAVKGSGSMVMYLLAMFIPYVLALSSFSGGMYSANDQIAGEKERGTLETLLVSPASRREIVLGKFGAVACVCLCSGILSVVGLSIPFLTHQSAALFGGSAGSSLGGLKLDAVGVLTIVLAQIPLALLFAGLLVAVSSFARTQKEVQVYQAPLLMLVLVPAMGSMFVSTDVPLGMAFLPVLNSTLVIKQVLAGVSNPAFLAVALLSSALYAAIGIGVSVRLFDNERVLLKS